MSCRAEPLNQTPLLSRVTPTCIGDHPAKRSFDGWMLRCLFDKSLLIIRLHTNIYLALYLVGNNLCFEPLDLVDPKVHGS